MSENENTTFQNLWDAAKAVLRDKFITINAYVIKEEKAQINSLISISRTWKERENYT